MSDFDSNDWGTAASTWGEKPGSFDRQTEEPIDAWGVSSKPNKKGSRIAVMILVVIAIVIATGVGASIVKDSIIAHLPGDLGTEKVTPAVACSNAERLLMEIAGGFLGGESLHAAIQEHAQTLSRQRTGESAVDAATYAVATRTQEGIDALNRLAVSGSAGLSASEFVKMAELDPAFVSLDEAADRLKIACNDLQAQR